MHYNNFKRHIYSVTHIALKNYANGTYLKILIKITRDNVFPFGEAVTDPFEVKFACKVTHFDYNSLDIDDNGDYFIKRNSIEWNKYLAEPGTPIKDFCERF